MTNQRFVNDQSRSLIHISQYEGYTDHFAGETDERILSAQLQLSSLGYLRPDALTGTLDDLTAQAIRDFQYENGLSVDGILGANTQAALFASGVSSAPSFLTDAQKNTMLGCVRAMLAGDWSDYDIISLLQQRLISLNYLDVYKRQTQRFAAHRYRENERPAVLPLVPQARWR